MTKKKQPKNDGISIPSMAEQDKWKAESNARVLREASAMTPAEKKQAMAKLREEQKAIEKALKSK